jgi:hypothetical protein
MWPLIEELGQTILQYCQRGSRPGHASYRWKIIPILNEAFVEFTPGWRPLMTWVFVAIITDEFFLGLDVLHTHDASMDLGLPCTMSEQ